MDKPVLVLPNNILQLSKLPLWWHHSSVKRVAIL